MDDAAVVMLLGSLGVLAIFVGLFVWGLRTGQFKDVEEPKYRMMGDIYRNEKREDRKGRKEGDDRHA